MFEISIVNTDKEERESTSTKGFLLLYLEEEKVKMKGQMDLKTLAPVLTRMALEKLTK